MLGWLSKEGLEFYMMIFMIVLCKDLIQNRLGTASIENSYNINKRHIFWFIKHKSYVTEGERSNNGMLLALLPQAAH